MELLLGVLLNYFIVRNIREETVRAYDEIAYDMMINYNLSKDLERQLEQCKGD